MVLKFDIIETEKGVTLIVNSIIKEGEQVTSLADVPIIPVNNKYAVTKNENMFFDTEGNPVARFNHSCEPTLYVNFDDWSFRAIRDLKSGDELTFNYFTTEFEMAASFDCLCKSKNCFGKISGFKNLPKAKQDEVLAKFKVSAFITEKIKTLD